jgi:beta-xylosidase
MGGIMEQREYLWKADGDDGTYSNPILYADYSDPDVVRVGDTFYMTASSFNYTPGLPILTSNDLVNWELKNYAVETIDYPRYDHPAHAKGIWAPSITYHNNIYRICYGMPDEGIFIVQTDNPLGKWSKPQLILEGKGLIDPCPFWDDDGKAYIIHGYARSRIGFKSILGMFQINEEATMAIGEDHFIYDGTRTQETIEGPKVYKRNGWYYIFAPAGGVKQGWQTVLRSKSIYGPYEERVVLAQGKTAINGPHQGAYVSTAFGEDWFIHFQDRGIYGRITHLQPVQWKEDWPIIGVNADEAGCGEPCLNYTKPKGLVTPRKTYLKASDDFNEERLNLQWQWLGNQKKAFYSLGQRQGFLRLFSLNTTNQKSPILWNSSNVLTQKFICPSFEAKVVMNYQGMKLNELAGLTIIGGNYNYLALRKTEQGMSIVYGESADQGKEKVESSLAEIKLDKELGHESQHIYFKSIHRIIEEEMVVDMNYSFDDRNYVKMDAVFKPTDHTWVGAKVGLFSIALDDTLDHGYVDIQSFEVNLLKEN